MPTRRNTGNCSHEPCSTFVTNENKEDHRRHDGPPLCEQWKANGEEQSVASDCPQPVEETRRQISRSARNASITCVRCLRCVRLKGNHA